MLKRQLTISFFLLFVLCITTSAKKPQQLDKVNSTRIPTNHHNNNLHSDHSNNGKNIFPKKPSPAIRLSYGHHLASPNNRNHNSEGKFHTNDHVGFPIRKRTHLFDQLMITSSLNQNSDDEDDFFLTDRQKYSSEFEYISPFQSYSLPVCCTDTSDSGDSVAIIEVEKLMNMAIYSKQIEIEKCNNAQKDAMFGVDCMVATFEYVYSKNSTTSNDSASISPTYSSMHTIMEVFLKDLKNITETVGEHAIMRKIPEAVISLRINIQSNVLECNVDASFSTMFNSSVRSIANYKVFFEFYSDNNSSIDCYGKNLFVTDAERVFTIFRRLVIYNMIQAGSATFIDNCFMKFTRMSHTNFLIISNSTVSGGGLISNAQISLFSTIKYLNNLESPIDLRVGKNIIITNSEITFYASDLIIGPLKLWIVNTTINIDTEFSLEEIYEVMITRSVVNFKGKSQVPQHASFQIIFSAIVRIFHTQFGRLIGNSALGIGECIDVIIYDLVFKDFQNQHGSIVSARNSRNIFFKDCLFENNLSLIGALNLENIVACFITNSKFIDNVSMNEGGAIQVSSPMTYVTMVTSTLFLRNQASGGGGAIKISRNTLSIQFSQFYENHSNLGGAVCSIGGVISVVESDFQHNSADHSGGSIYSTGNFTVVSSNFNNNTLLSIEPSNGFMCSGICPGNGGAICLLFGQAYGYSDNKITISNTKFTNNRATRGGAVSLRFFGTIDLGWDSVEFTGNTAEYGGGAIFFHTGVLKEALSSSFSRNRATFYGNDVASSIYSVQWSLLLQTNVDGTSSKEKQFRPLTGTLSLFPGQLFSLKPIMMDYFGNNIADLWEYYTGSVNDSSHEVIIPKQFHISEKIDGIFITSTLPQVAKSNTELQVQFSFLKSKINIQVMGCPDQYEVTSATYAISSSYICKALPSFTTVVVVAVVSTFVVFTVLLLIAIIIIYFTARLLKKVFYWRRRDKAEKDIEKRLLENELHHTREEMEASEEFSNSRNSFYIIGLDQIYLEKKIGEGGAGIVFKGRWNHNVVAVKCLRTDGNSTVLASDEIEKEASLLCKLRHPNVLLFYGISVTPMKHYLIVEYLEKGSLENLINEGRKLPGTLTMNTKLSILIDVACGMEYLHSLKPPIIHRDLKPGNILLDTNNNAKVCDFGLSKLMTNTCLNTTTMGVGTLFYMAPELFKSEMSMSSVITPAIDVFSFSIIMYELFFEENPYIQTKSSKLHSWKTGDVLLDVSSSSPFTVIPKIMRGERPFIPFNDDHEMDEYLQSCMPEYIASANVKSVSGLEAGFNREKFRHIINEFIQLMVQCWSTDPTLRPNFTVVKSILASLKSRLTLLSLSQAKSSTRNYTSLVEMEDK